MGLTPDNIVWAVRTVLTGLGLAGKESSPWADLAALLLAQFLAVVMLGLALAGLWIADRIMGVAVRPILTHDPRARGMIVAALILSVALVIAGAG